MTTELARMAMMGERHVCGTKRSDEKVIVLGRADMKAVYYRLRPACIAAAAEYLKLSCWTFSSIGPICCDIFFSQPGIESSLLETMVLSGRWKTAQMHELRAAL